MQHNSASVDEAKSILTTFPYVINLMRAGSVSCYELCHLLGKNQFSQRESESEID